MRSIYESKYTVENECDIDFVKLPWDLSVLRDRMKQGIYRIDLTNKEILWFENIHKAVIHYNKSNGIDEFPNDKGILTPHLRERTKINTKDRLMKGYYWCMAFSFSKKNLEYNYINLPRPIISNKGEKFNIVEDAADFLINEGIAKGTKKRVVHSLKNNLQGKTKKSYKRTWNFQKE